VVVCQNPEKILTSFNYISSPI